MKYLGQVVRDSQNVISPAVLIDTSSSLAANLPNLLYSDVNIAYFRQGDTAFTSGTEATMTDSGTYANWGFLEMDTSGVAEGGYVFCLPDAAFASATGVNWVMVHIWGGTNQLDFWGYFELVDSIPLSASGNVQADVKEINDVAITGDGSATPFNV